MQISLGFSGAAVVGAIISPMLGKYLDDHSPRRAILIGICVVALSYVMLARVQNLWQFYLIVGLGFGTGMSLMGGMAWHRSVIFWFDHWRGRAIAFAVMGASLAGIMMPPLVTALVDEFGWRAGYYMFAASTAGTLLPLVYFLMRDRPEDMGEVRDGHAYVARHGTDLIDFVVDRNTHKQGKLMPGVHIPIHAPEKLLEDQPDYVLMLTWNFRDEILQQQQEYMSRGGQFIIPIPAVEIVSQGIAAN